MIFSHYSVIFVIRKHLQHLLYISPISASIVNNKSEAKHKLQ